MAAGDAGGAIEDAAVSVVTVNYRTADLTLAALAALAAERSALPHLRAIIVDGGSGDGSAERLGEAMPDFADFARLMPLPINGGYGYANNQAILAELQRPDPPEFIHLLNPDTRVSPGALAALVAHMRAKPDCGAVGSQLVDPAGHRHISAFRFPSVRGELARGAETHALLRLTGTPDPVIAFADAAIEVDWVPGASVMIRADALRQVGLFDDGFFLYFEEVELMHRIKAAGWSIWHEPASRVEHVAGAATGVRADATRAAAVARPDYWYRAQRRAMMRMLGTGRAYAAFGAWLAGRAIGATLDLVKRERVSNRPAGELRGMMRAWGRAPGVDGRGAAVDWRSAPGLPPAWERDR